VGLGTWMMDDRLSEATLEGTYLRSHRGWLVSSARRAPTAGRAAAKATATRGGMSGGQQLRGAHAQHALTWHLHCSARGTRCASTLRAPSRRRGLRLQQGEQTSARAGGSLHQSKVERSRAERRHSTQASGRTETFQRFFGRPGHTVFISCSSWQFLCALNGTHLGTSTRWCRPLLPATRHPRSAPGRIQIAYSCTSRPVNQLHASLVDCSLPARELLQGVSLASLCAWLSPVDAWTTTPRPRPDAPRSPKLSFRREISQRGNLCVWLASVDAWTTTPSPLGWCKNMPPC
jgi:hypothetical protein